MKKGRFTEHQIVAALKKQEAGISVKDISREMVENPRKLTPRRQNKLTPFGHFKLTP
jgi:putative transposase